MVELDGHRTAEHRSLVYHRRIAEMVVTDAAVLARVRAKLKAQLEAGGDGTAARYTQGWSRWLEGPAHELVAFITSDSQEAKDFRQSSPFAGALSPRERWLLWRRAGMEASMASGEGRAPR
jgi:hypothetical protein